MAQLLAPSGPDPGRISQILPSVKCSNCNQPVPIAELGDHVCPPPPTPASKANPPMSPVSATFLHQKYQNIISSRPATPTSPHSPLRSRPATPGSPGGQQRVISLGPAAQPPHVRAASTVSLNIPHPQNRPDRVPSPLARPANADNKVAFPTQPGTPDSPAPPHSPRHSPSEPTRVSTLGGSSSRTSSAPARPPMSPDMLRTMQAPQRTPSPAAASPVHHTANASQNGIRHPVQSTPAHHAPAPPGNMSDPRFASRPRATTNLDASADVIYSTARQGAPPSPNPSADMRMRAPSAASMQSFASIPIGGMLPSPGMGPPPQTPNLPLDTKSGGEAGMAGVGRRGFAAAARAAMFAHQMGMHASSPIDSLSHADQIPGMDGRRANAPRFLDIASATNYNIANTPPLSADSSSPHSPYSQHSPSSARTPSPGSDGRTSVTPTQPVVRRPSGQSERSFIYRDRALPPASEPPKVPLPDIPTTPSLPFFEKFKMEHKTDDVPSEESPAPEPPIPEPPLSPQESESEYGGLAYADSTDGEDDDATSHDGTVKPQDTSDQNKVRFPSMVSLTRSDSKYSSASSKTAQSPRLLNRSLSQSTTYTVRSAAKSTGALDHTMETLFEEDPASPTTSASSPVVTFAQEGQRDSMRPKLPIRAHTTPGLGQSRPDSTRAPGKKRAPKVARVCLKCDKTIEDGRWIMMEGGGVMCDKCWKNMYLPKCRRCNLTIEKQAVSSSDGQLKGKYHRECFNCHTCHKPFPDKSFYVFDGKPFCAYHYHEANNSLCAAAACGQPIEGPCAVSHAGDRYHPEHFLCEYPRCNERLVEYWEVDGRMFCEKHADGVDSDESDDEDVPLGLYKPQGDNSTPRATKRVTRFIDLTAGGLLGGAGAGAGGPAA